jgi:hypothetical protein
MAFRFDKKSARAVDDVCGFQVYRHGVPDGDYAPYVFFDPQSSIIGKEGPGKFRFEARLLTRVEHPIVDGVVRSVPVTDGYSVSREAFVQETASYVGGDPTKLKQLQDLVSKGMVTLFLGIGGKPPGLVTFD